VWNGPTAATSAPLLCARSSCVLSSTIIVDNQPISESLASVNDQPISCGDFFVGLEVFVLESPRGRRLVSPRGRLVCTREGDSPRSHERLISSQPNRSGCSRPPHLRKSYEACTRSQKARSIDGFNAWMFDESRGTRDSAPGPTGTAPAARNKLFHLHNETHRVRSVRNDRNDRNRNDSMNRSGLCVEAAEARSFVFVKCFGFRACASYHATIFNQVFTRFTEPIALCSYSNQF
jgi:hypothetical protein